MYFYFAIDTISYSCARQVDAHNPFFFEMGKPLPLHQSMHVDAHNPI
jgi:hypothetical protein